MKTFLSTHFFSLSLLVYLTNGFLRRATIRSFSCAKQINVLRKQHLHAWYKELNLWMFYSFLMNFSLVFLRPEKGRHEGVDTPKQTERSLLVGSLKISAWRTNSIWCSREVESVEEQKQAECINMLAVKYERRQDISSTIFLTCRRKDKSFFMHTD